MYGVDFLSTQDILRYFDGFGTLKIEWLNDSSCNVVFASEEATENASKDLALTLQDPNLSEEWKKGIPYKERGIEFSLFFRLATTKVSMKINSLLTMIVVLRTQKVLVSQEKSRCTTST